MKFESLTHKAQEVLKEARRLADTRQHPEVSCEHLLLSLLAQKEGIVPLVLERMGVNLADLAGRVNKDMMWLPKNSAQDPAQATFSQSILVVIAYGEKKANLLCDEFVGTEHLLLGILHRILTSSSKNLSAMGVSEESFLDALKALRGASRVTSQKP